MLQSFRLAIVEGFYGREWSWQQRQANLLFLAAHGFTEYLYAPKGDRYLRQQWSQSWPSSQANEISRLAKLADENGVVFSIGLSPLAYGQASKPGESELLARVESIISLGIKRIYLLFDDMRGDDPGLAKKQAAIIHAVLNQFPGISLGFCPSYYSDDPVLDKLFGQRPESYLEQLGELIDPEVGIFWTGEKVCSSSYSVEHISRVERQLKRKPLLWDNYPVNDGQKLCTHLHLMPFNNRPAALAEHLSAHFANPMNQALLSRIPLLTLPAVYSGNRFEAKALFKEAMPGASEKETELLLRDYIFFTEHGLTAMQAAQQEKLKNEYADIDGDYAREVYDWLDGRYTFDPACLT